MLILGWVVWVIAASIACGGICYMRADAKKEQPIHILMVFQVLLMLSSVAAFIIGPWNKLNLIWVMPACFFGTFLGFVVFRVPIVGTVLRVITLGFARLFFIGTGADGPTPDGWCLGLRRKAHRRG
jgi:hypothetical protein